jgi:phage head maturation protease
MEKRTMVCRGTKYRATEENDDIYIEGYFSVFNSNYEICPGVSESIQPGAFAGALGGDVRALANHDTTLVLGRTQSGTLERTRTLGPRQNQPAGQRRDEPLSPGPARRRRPMLLRL